MSLVTTKEVIVPGMSVVTLDVFLVFLCILITVVLFILTVVKIEFFLTI